LSLEIGRYPRPTKMTKMKARVSERSVSDEATLEREEARELTAHPTPPSGFFSA